MSVPSIDDMDDDTFLKHMDKRHAHEVLAGPLSVHPDRNPSWVNPYRAFHDRVHEIESPATEHDHEHLW